MDQKISAVFETILELMKGEKYLRKLARDLNRTHATLGRTLEVLREKNIVGSRREGKIRKFYLRETIESRLFLMMAERYKLFLFLRRYPKFRPMIRELVNSKYRLIIIFGSYADFSAGKESDLISRT